MKRRDFLKYIGLGGLGTGLGIIAGQAIKPPGAKLIPYLIPPEDVIPGVANWYASLCTQCGAGCGTLVKVMEGRAKKVEGNPRHPVNKGKLCARGQASLQALYNPDRIKGPLKRSGPRGSGSFEKISWEEGISILARNLSDLESDGEQAKLYLLSGTVHGHLNNLIDDFMRAYGSKNHLTHELFGTRNLEYANRAALGLDAIPHYDIGKTRYLLSFGADFSSTWLSAVNLSYGYGQMRSRPGGRGHLVQVEPRMSLTGASADEWVPAKPGTEGVLALAIAHEIVGGGYYRGGDAEEWKALLKKYTPEYAAAITDVKAGRIHAIAKEFATMRPSLAIGGDSVAGYKNGVSGLVAINILNHLAGNVAVQGGLTPNPDILPNTVRNRGAKDGLSELRTDVAGLSLKVKTLLISGTNPAFTAPGAAKMEEVLKAVPFIASFSSFMDETTALADLVLPAHTALEDWGDDFAYPSVGYQVATIMQPIVTPVFNTRGVGDIFISLGRAMGGRVGASMPGKGFKEYLEASWKDLYKKDREMSGSAVTFAQFWNRLLREGGWWPGSGQGEKTPPAPQRAPSVSPRALKRYISKVSSGFDGDDKEYPFYLMLYPQTGLGDGRGANLPWLQEMPDPMTSVVWGSWVEINPKTAKKLGIREKDLVVIESPSGTIKAPAYLHAGIRPDTVSIPVGQGHSRYGRHAEKRGVNPLALLQAKVEPNSGAFALNSTRVKLSRSGRSRMVMMAASTNEHGRGISQTISPRELRGEHKVKVIKH